MATAESCAEGIADRLPAPLPPQRLSQEKHTSDSDSVVTGETSSPAARREPGEHGMASVPSQEGCPCSWRGAAVCITAGEHPPSEG